MPETRGRNSQLLRLLSIIADLDRLGGVDLYELAERHGATVRTIRRDLEALEASGFNLVSESDGRRKRWRIDARHGLRRLSSLLDVRHYLGLRLAMGEVGTSAGASSVFADLEDLAHKIEKALGPASRGTLEAIDACFHSYEKHAYRQAPPDVFWPLVVAISDHRLCKVTYRAPRPKARDKTFQVLPLRLFSHAGGIYLMAHQGYYDTYLKLNLQRLRSLRVLDRRGEVPGDFDPEAVENAAFGVFHGGKVRTFKLRFTPELAPYIRERTWHPSQRLVDLDDSGVELTFRCSESHEISSWVASWLGGAEVLEPESLREEMAALGRKLMKTHNTGG